VASDKRHDLDSASRRTARLAVRFLSDPLTAISVIAFGAVIIIAVVGPMLWRLDPLAVDLPARLEPPSWVHPMGTDDLGRDVLARFMAGAAISLTTGLAAVLIGSTVGGTIGVLAGALGGAVDQVIGRVLDAVLAFPSLILAMAITVATGAGLYSAALGVVLTSLPYYARIIRADVLKVRALSYTEASVALGATSQWTIRRHIIPNVISSLPILAAANFGYSILTLAALSFVGLGAQIPTPEWGAMITEGQGFILTGSWWVGVFPGLGVLAVVTCANIFADRLRDLLDPRGELGTSS
jgi:peptide/nickel transport system permease protein